MKENQRILSYVMVSNGDTGGFNRECEELVKDGYVPYGEPFCKEAHETASTYHFPKLCQAFVLYNKAPL